MAGLPGSLHQLVMWKGIKKETESNFFTTTEYTHTCLCIHTYVLAPTHIQTCKRTLHTYTLKKELYVQN